VLKTALPKVEKPIGTDKNSALDQYKKQQQEKAENKK
jgi:hypothetical protein